MSHEITENVLTGKKEMAYRGEAPWHGLGQQLPAGAPIETWIDAAGMAWSIEDRSMSYQFGDKRIDVPERKVLVRSDTGEALGVVGRKYKQVQPEQVLRFFDKLTGSEGFELETAGTLFGGKKLWALAKVGNGFSLGKEDQVKPYLLLSTACDGTMATTARFTTIRVVCNNTLSLAVNGKAEVKLSHRQVFDPDQLHQELGFVTETAKQFHQDAARLAKRKVTQAEADAFVRQLVLDANFIVQKDVEAVRQTRPYQFIMQLFEGKGQGANISSAKGTAWGLVNAVTEHVDHVMLGRSRDHQLASAWFGKGDEAKRLALDLALKL